MISDPLDYGAFLPFVRDNETFVLTTHVNPDGDALGSEIGFAEWLLSLGKSVRIVNHSPTPYNYTFLDRPDPLVQQFDENVHTAIVQNADVIFVLDVNDADRTRSLATLLEQSRHPVIVIDHHLNPKPFATHYLIDTEACSTGELIMRLIAYAKPILGGEISKKAATALYVAIMTDTGSFRFPRTTAAVFRMCADLIELGSDPVMTYNEIYNTSPPGRLHLIRDSLTSLEYHYDGRVAVQAVQQSQLKAANALEEDVDGLVQLPFQVKGVVLSVFLLELKEGWKVSARSKDNVSAARLAQSFGGNGHFHAAGARVKPGPSFGDMIQKIVENAGTVLAEANALTPEPA